MSYRWNILAYIAADDPDNNILRIYIHIICRWTNEDLAYWMSMLIRYMKIIFGIHDWKTATPIIYLAVLNMNLLLTLRPFTIYAAAILLYKPLLNLLIELVCAIRRRRIEIDTPMTTFDLWIFTIFFFIMINLT